MAKTGLRRALGSRGSRRSMVTTPSADTLALKLLSIDASMKFWSQSYSLKSDFALLPFPGAGFKVTSIAPVGGSKIVIASWVVIGPMA
jgi:hypothetical protein